MRQNYKWTVEFNKNTLCFLVASYVWVNDRWSRDGATLSFSSLDDALLSIKQSEPRTSRTT